MAGYPYIVGNIMYSYLSEYYLDGPNRSDVASDSRDCAAYYNKLRFAITGDIYPHPSSKPFLDEQGDPTDDGNYSHRPNPEWFHNRVDLAVKTAFEHDMIADMIINSVDSQDGRSLLRAFVFLFIPPDVQVTAADIYAHHLDEYLTGSGFPGFGHVLDAHISLAVSPFYECFHGS